MAKKLQDFASLQAAIASKTAAAHKAVESVSVALPSGTLEVLIAISQGGERLMGGQAAIRQFKGEKQNVGYGLYGKVVLDSGMPAMLQVGDNVMAATLREFSKGSWGWNFNGKAEINGQRCQVGGNLVAVNSALLGRPTGKVVAQVSVNVVIIKAKVA